MTFTVLPAIDVAGGLAVRPVRANGGGAGRDPVAVGLGWQAAGASTVHLVDVDAAYGRGSNHRVLAEVIGVLDIPVVVARGIVDDASLDRALATGCQRVNLGTAALADPAWCGRAIGAHGDRLAVSLDVHLAAGDGPPRRRLVGRGTALDVGDLGETLAELDRLGCARYVVTDVDRDGTMLGPNLDLLRAVAGATRAGVVASGGVGSLDDLVALASLTAGGAGLEGAVVGTALDDGRVTLPEVHAALEGLGRPAHGT